VYSERQDAADVTQERSDVRITKKEIAAASTVTAEVAVVGGTSSALPPRYF
jgi:hypothetical protein